MIIITIIIVYACMYACTVSSFLSLAFATLSPSLSLYLAHTTMTLQLDLVHQQIAAIILNDFNTGHSLQDHCWTYCCPGITERLAISRAKDWLRDSSLLRVPQVMRLRKKTN